MISKSDFLWFVDRALDDMTAILVELGDERTNTTPSLAGANSPYAIVTHCLGVMGFWGGDLVAGRSVERDREAEFRATGRVVDLLEKIRVARAAFEADCSDLQASGPLSRPPAAGFANFPYGKNQGSALFHVYAELAQHLGQLEITRDLLTASH